jgi:hypothetical protein
MLQQATATTTPIVHELVTQLALIAGDFLLELRWATRRLKGKEPFSWWGLNYWRLTEQGIFVRAIAAYMRTAMKSNPANQAAFGRDRYWHSLLEGAGLVREDQPLFTGQDLTAGSETELQAAVSGPKDKVDLPLTIQGSNFYRNLIQRLHRGEAPRSLLNDLEGYLTGNQEGVWENSWVRMPQRLINAFADGVLKRDLLADKSQPELGQRSDTSRFVCHATGESWLRLPVSYLLKLSLAQVLGSRQNAPSLIMETGAKCLQSFSSDNTSPETCSFYVIAGRESGLGQAVAKEAALRHLLCQLLTQHAEHSLGLKEAGQRPLVYLAPSPPARQKRLNDCVSDSFYRELFMSPCLSGWDRGEDKHRYMHLCHQVLSRSQLNAVAKLKEAGIITRNLVVLPNTSNTCLANNGIHLSLGSRRLGAALGDPGSGFGPAQEKYLADLVIKAMEHFLPLFVGTYSAAPQRLAFSDFHPERALGFLPHELDFTHLRMIWRRWKKKAKLKVLGRPLTPFGPLWLDRNLARLLRLRGDLVPDFRLLDYLASLLSTDSAPGLDGTLGNHERLLADLTEAGVFDRKMAMYLLYRQREYAKMGYSGFEGRHYSLFPSFTDDLAPAADLQALVTALCYQYALSGRISHALIPDGPELESERRQIFFGAAVGVPTFFVRADTPNLFLKMIVERCRRVRPSRRYPGYLRVHNLEYRRALLGLIREDGAELGELFGMEELLGDLADRLEDWPRRSAAGRLTAGVLNELGLKDPLKAPAEEFNQAAERFYRTTLLTSHMREALNIMAADARVLEAAPDLASSPRRQALEYIAGGQSAAALVDAAQSRILNRAAGQEELGRLINLLLLNIQAESEASQRALAQPIKVDHATSLYRQMLG